MVKKLAPQQKQQVAAADLRLFTRHGFRESGVAGNQVKGRCVLCGDPDHFYINGLTHKWDCKKCGKLGSPIAFLREVDVWCQQQLRGMPAVNLAKDRGLRLATLRHGGVGYNPYTGNYTIPLYNLLESDGISDLRTWQLSGKRGLCSTQGAKLTLWNWHTLEKANVIWLCEGEWDGMAMHEVLQDLHFIDRGECAVAVPGANTFKPEWSMLLERKVVNVLFDNDPAGEAGDVRIYNLLKPIVSELRFIHWEEKRPVGWDVRDHYTKEHKQDTQGCYASLQSMLHTEPRTPPQTIAAGAAPAVTIRDRLDGAGLSIADVRARYSRWLHIPPQCHLLDVIFGTVLANRRGGDPLWMFIVAPPGFMKTEPLISLSDSPHIVTTTSLTPATLISGANFGGGDPSLIPRLRGNVLVVKDFTTILNLPSIQRDEIFGILRDAYDGKTEKQFGNGIYRKYEDCTFGLLAGVTPAIEQFSEGCAALGERFLQFWTPVPSAIKEQRIYLQRAKTNEGHERQLRADLLATAKEVLSKDYSKQAIPDISAALGDKLVDLALLTSRARGVVPRDKFTKDITHRPYHEMGTRMTKQFVKLSIGIAQFRDEAVVSKDSYGIVRDISRDSIPSGVRAVLRTFDTECKTSLTTGEISEMVRLPQTPTVQRILQNMEALNMVKKNKVSMMRTEYRLTTDTQELLESTAIFKEASSCQQLAIRE
jgi:hypothetical protein